MIDPELAEKLIDLTNASRIEEVWDIHCKRMTELGFDRVLYGFTRYRTAQSLGDPKDFVLLSNLDPEYLNAFIDEGLYMSAPMVNWALDNDGYASWGMLRDMANAGAMSDGEKRVFEYNRKVGVTAGYTISFRSVSARSKGAIALIAPKCTSQDEADAAFDRHRYEIVLRNNLVHLKVLTLPYSPPSRALTARQREALEWVGDGKTMQDIAQIMGLTQATIEKHLRLAREALDVDTTAQAVMKAAFQNQMFVLER